MKKPTKPAATDAPAHIPGEKKRYPRLRSHITHAASLQRRVATGEVTPAEAREYQRIIAEFRRKYLYGQLSPASARQFGID